MWTLCKKHKELILRNDIHKHCPKSDQTIQWPFNPRLSVYGRVSYIRITNEVHVCNCSIHAWESRALSSGSLINWSQGSLQKSGTCAQWPYSLWTTPWYVCARLVPKAKRYKNNEQAARYHGWKTTAIKQSCGTIMFGNSNSTNRCVPVRAVQSCWRLI